MEGEQMHVYISPRKGDAQNSSHQAVYKLYDLSWQTFTNIC